MPGKTEPMACATAAAISSTGTGAEEGTLATELCGKGA